MRSLKKHHECSVVTDNGLSQHEAAQKHGMPQTTLSDRLRGIPPKSEVTHPGRLLSKSQEARMIDYLDTSARGPRLCSIPQSSPRHHRCPPTTTRQGTAYRCTLASQVRETLSTHKEQGRKTSGIIEVQLFDPGRRQLVL
ncbi:hypothetical protein FPOAC2_13924 [Fusarium poae]